MLTNPTPKPGQYTPEQMLEMYNAGHYIFPAPPVCTAYWDDSDWIAFIDRSGRWTPPAHA